jgi:hypothetical protein
VGNELIDLELALHVIIDQARKLGAAFDTAKRTSLKRVIVRSFPVRRIGLLPTFQTRPVTSWNAAAMLAMENNSATGLAYAGLKFLVQQLRRR